MELDLTTKQNSNQLLVPMNQEHYTHRKYWEFMRDSWMGQSTITNEAIINRNKHYLHKRENMTDNSFAFYARCGRYPELVSRLLRMSVERTILQEPQGYEQLRTISDDPDELVRWALTQVGLVGSCGMALSFDADRTRTAMFNTERVINWSCDSIAFEDAIIQTDRYGFAESDDIVQKIYYVEDRGTIEQRVMLDVLGETEGESETFAVISNSGRPIKRLPAVRVTTDNKPLFYSLAESCIEYYKVSAHRWYVLHQIVPQPVLTLPPSDTSDAFEMSQLYADGNIDYGIGTFMKLPHGAKFEIVSPVVRQLGEMRQELTLIKDEMVIQGAQPYFQKAGQVNTLNDASIRMHTDDQVMTFSDVQTRVEIALNYLLDVQAEADGLERSEDFKFKRLDYSPEEIEDFVKSFVGSYDQETGAPIDEDFTQRILDEIEQRDGHGHERNVR